MKTVAFVANYAAGKNQLELVAKALEARGGTAIRLLTVNEHFTEAEVEAAISDADAVVVGMAPSEQAAMPEQFAIIIASSKKIPCYFYADTFGSAFRPWCAPLYDFVTGIFVPNEYEAKRVQKAFPEVTVYPVGNPGWWMARTPSISKEEARKRIGAEEGEYVILFGGTKQELADFHANGSLVNACLLTEGRFCIVYTLHPGTGADGDEATFLEAIDDGLKRIPNAPILSNDVRAVLGSKEVRRAVLRYHLKKLLQVPKSLHNRVRTILAPAEVSTEQAQCAADIVCESMSQTGIVASLRRQPLITFMGPMYREHLRYLQGGSDAYPLLGETVTWLAPEEPRVLKRLLIELLAKDGVLSRGQTQRERQREFLKLSRNPAEAICDVLFAL